jgi:hypothetical protein
MRCGAKLLCSSVRALGGTLVRQYASCCPTKPVKSRATCWLLTVGLRLSARAARHNDQERRTHAESLPLSLLVPTYVIGPQRVGTRSPLVKPLQSQATARPATRAGWPGWIVAGVTSGLRITFFAAEPELPRTRLSLRQSVDEDAPIAGDVEMSRGYEDRGKMA